jgi:hypothetical protein
MELRESIRNTVDLAVRNRVHYLGSQAYLYVLAEEIISDLRGFAAIAAEQKAWTQKLANVLIGRAELLNDRNAIDPLVNFVSDTIAAWLKSVETGA